jgi:hypothetical protein
MVPLATGGYRYMGLLELEKLPAADRRAYQSKLPPSYDAAFRRCKLCYFWGEKDKHLIRHIHGAHLGKSLKDCFDSPFLCLYRPPRDKDVQGVPFGPPKPRCLLNFPSKYHLDAHKLEHDPDAAAKKEKKKGQKAQKVAKEAAPALELAVQQAVPAPLKAGRKKKRTEVESDSEKMDLEEPSDSAPAPPPHRRQRRSEQPKEAFLAFLAQIETSLASGITSQIVYQKLIEMIDSKAYIRSDSLPLSLKQLWRASDKDEATIKDLIARARDFAENTYNW